MLNAVNLLKNYTIDQNLPLEDYPSHYCRYKCDLEAADKLVTILKGIPALQAFGGHYKATAKGGSAWYVGLRNDPGQTWLFNFNVTGKSPSVDFRRLGHLLVNDKYKELLSKEHENLKQRAGQTKYATWNNGRLRALILESLPAYELAIANGDLAGDSYAEKIIPILLSSVYDDKYAVKTNTRPSWLKGLKGKSYELDHFIEEVKLAIENQGAHHYVDGVYKNTTLADVQERDNLKKQLCREKGITLLWIKVSPLTKIYGLDRALQIEWLKDLVGKAQQAENKFYHWEG